MSADTILVIDAGTSAMRAVAVSGDGGASTIASEPWRIFVPEDGAPFGREFAAAEVLGALDRLLDAALRADARYAGITFTGQREGIALVDAEGDALLLSPNVDARASAEGMAIDARCGGDVYRATGHLPSLMQATAKLAWLREHRPEVADRVRYALPLSDWLASTLTGGIAASRSLLVENGLIDLTTNAPVSALGESSERPTSIVPPLIADGSIAGEWRKHAGRAPVAICGGDTQCALVGMGAVAAGSAGVPAGWSAPLQVVTSKPMLDGAQRTWAGTHVVPAQYVVESNAGETGRVWQWLLSMFELEPEAADAIAATSPPGARDVMAVLGPARMNAAAMNAGVGGITLPLPLVMSSPERADVLRAVVEAIAFAIRANLEQAEEVTGTRVAELRLGGGMSRSALFAQIVADVIERPVLVAEAAETSALGAAALAALALGVHDSFAGTMSAMVRTRAVEPGMRRAAQYEDVYGRWLAMCETFESGL